MNDEEFEKVWRKITSDIEKINTRTKCHTIQIRDLEKIYKERKEERLK